jgi:hypothetical protein
VVAGSEGKLNLNEPKIFTPVMCTIQKAIALNVGDLDYYEVTVKENGATGFLLCANEPHLLEGQEFCAQLVHRDAKGSYILQNSICEFNSDGKLVPNYYQSREQKKAKIVMEVYQQDWRPTNRAGAR